MFGYSAISQTPFSTLVVLETSRCFINCTATLTALGFIVGSNWADVSPVFDTWTDITVDDNTWTEVTTSSNTWIQQG